MTKRYCFKIKASKILIRILIILLIVNCSIFLFGLIHNYQSPRLLLLNLYILLPALLITAYSPIYSFIIDNEKHQLFINYRFLYFIDKQIILSFDQFDYKYNYGAPFISLGGFEVNIYFKKCSIATLNTKFGWKKKQLKEIVSILEEIKPPKPRLLDKKEKA